MKIYLVGGCVRDHLLGLQPKDVDYVVVGSTPEEMLSLGYSQVGAAFPVFLKNGEEYALARKERKMGVGYNGFAVEFDRHVTLEDDLIRRDLTINSMAMDMDTHEIIDPYNGQQDLILGVLRHTSAAFAEDPVRVLRTSRFAARYGFDIDPDTIVLMRKISPELDFVPQERIWAEFEKGMMERRPSRMMEALESCDALDVAALLPYIGWSHALKSVTDRDDAFVRFSLLARGFSDGDYEHCKIPTPLSRVSKSVNKHLADLLQYTDLGVADRLRMLMDLRALNDKSHINNVVKTAIHWMPDHQASPILARINDDINAAKRVDAESIAKLYPSRVKEAIFEARVVEMSAK